MFFKKDEKPKPKTEGEGEGEEIVEDTLRKELLE
jgi:hypothetical protein